MKNNKKYFIVLLFKFLLLFSINASASDEKMYAGADCLPFDQTYDVNRGSGFLWSVHYSGNRKFVCPIVNDVDDKYSSIEGWVYVYDRNIKSDTSCSIHSVTPYNKSWYYSARSTNGGFSSYPIKLTFSKIYNSNHGEEITPVAMLRCSIPPKDNGYFSGVKNYYIKEN